MKRGWQTKTLGEVIQLVSGQHIEAKDYNTDSRGVGYLTGPSDFGSINPIVSKWTEFPKVKALRGDILITVKGSGVGKINLLDQDEVAISRQLMAVRVSGAEPRFVYAFLSSTFDHFQSESTGAAIPGISREQVLGLKIPVPPRPEQQRVVGILEEAFDGLATATANAEQNLRNARALFESHLQAVFNKRGDGWVEKQLGDIAEFKNGLNFTRQSKGQTLRMVGVGDFQDNSVVPTGSLQSVTIDGELPDDYLIRRDDILTVRSNGSKDLVGRCMLVPDVDGMTSYSGFIIRIRFDTSQISPRFLLRFMKSSQTRERLTRDGGGANISNINQAKLSELPISLPSFSQQEDIANRLDAIAAETQRLESIYQRKLAALGELKKSLLHRAFSGAL